MYNKQPKMMYERQSNCAELCTLALNYALASLSEPAELQKCVLSDSLTTVSQGGQDLGNFSMTVDFGRKGQQSCMLLHALSQGAIDGSPCGTSVTGEFRARGPTQLAHVPAHQCPHVLCTI